METTKQSPATTKASLFTAFADKVKQDTTEKEEIVILSIGQSRTENADAADMFARIWIKGMEKDQYVSVSFYSSSVFPAGIPKFIPVGGLKGVGSFMPQEGGYPPNFVGFQRKVDKILADVE